MTRDEVLNELHKLGLSISSETLRRWVNAGLVAMPRRGNIGRAGGRWSEYEYYAPWEAYAAGVMLKDNSISQIVEIRQEALSCISEIGICELGELSRSAQEWREANKYLDGPEEGGIIIGGQYSYPDLPEGEFSETTVIDRLVYQWILLRLKAEFHIPLDKPARISISYSGDAAEAEGQGKNKYGFYRACEYDGYIYYANWTISAYAENDMDRDYLIIEDYETSASILIQPRKRSMALKRE